MAPQLQRLMRSGYVTVAAAVAGFLAIIWLQNVSEARRDEAYQRQLNVVNAELALIQLMRDISHLRAWDDSWQITNNAEAQGKRDQIKSQILTKRDEMVRHESSLTAVSDTEALRNQIELYIALSDKSDALRKRLIQKIPTAEQQDLDVVLSERNAAVENLERGLATAIDGLFALEIGIMRDIENARLRTYNIVLYGSLALAMMFLVSGLYVTWAMRQQARRIQQSEERFRAFATASSDTLLELDRNYDIVEAYRVNPTGARDEKVSSVIGQSFFYKPDTEEAIALLNVLEKRQAFRDYVAKFPSPTGGTIWRRLNGVPITDEDGAFHGYRLSVVDITAQKTLEQENSARQAMYEQLVEQVPGAVFISRQPKDQSPGQPRVILEYVSESFTALTGYNSETANAHIASGGAIISLDDLDRLRDNRKSKPDGAIEIKTQVVRADGTIRAIIFRSRRIAPAANGDERNLGILVDITEVESAQEAVRERERLLTSILGNIGSAYFYSVIFGNGSIDPQFISDGVEKVLGYTTEEWKKIFRDGEERFAQTMPEDRRPYIIDMFRRMRLHAEAPYSQFQSTNRRIHKLGHTVHCLTRGQNKKLPDGRLLQEGMVIDVTADVLRQEELTRLKAAVDGASDSVAIWARTDRAPGGGRTLIYANKIAQAMIDQMGQPANDGNESWAAVRAAAETKSYLVEIDNAVEAYGKWNGQKTIVRKDGTKYIADITVTRINDDTDLHVVRDVTALHELEAANEKARTELQDVVAALDLAGEGLAITRAGREILFANRSFASWAVNGAVSEVLGLTFYDIISAADPSLDQIAKDMRQVVERGKVFTTEATVTLRKDGLKRVMRWTTAPLDEGRWINISRDITDIRTAERKRALLDRSVADIASRRDISKGAPRDAYASILMEVAKTLGAARVGIWRLAADDSMLQTVLLCASGEVITNKEVIGRENHEPYFDELLKLHSIVADDVLRNSATRCLAQSYLSRHGIASMLDLPIIWQGELWGVFCIEHVGPQRQWETAEVTYATYMADLVVMTLERIARDETQIQIEHLYKENASILSALDSTQERIIIEDAAGYVRYVNQAVADAWGRGSKSELMGRSFITAFPALQTYRRSLEIEARRDIAERGHWSGQLLLNRPSGEPAYVDIHVMELPDKGLLYTAQDVTERRRHEQREQQLKTQLIEAQKMESIGRLAGGVAHDFNNIIAAVRAFASLVASEVQAGSKARTYAERIINTSDRAADLVRQILLFSRASRAELKPIDVCDVMDEVTAYLRASIPASITLDITPPERSTIINGNSAQVIQILMNLGLNARDAIGERPGRIQIFTEEVILSEHNAAQYRPGLSISRTNRTDGVIVHQFVVGAPLPDQRYLCLTVRDNGPGMPGITVERMFEPFFTTKEKARGTGLGLPVVAAVVAAHSGFILVTTQQERGCRFNIYLPLSRHAVVDDHEQAPDFEKVKGDERILLVDDEADLADASALLLRKFGYDVVPMYYSRDALRIFIENPMAWDVVITDQVMPDMKGLEMIAGMKKVRPDIPAILCTGFSDFATERNAKALGADAFFTKPVLPEELAVAIRKLRSESAAAHKVNDDVSG